MSEDDRRKAIGIAGGVLGAGAGAYNMLRRLPKKPGTGIEQRAQQDNAGRRWHLINLDTSEEFVGDFEAEGITANVSANYNETNALNRQYPIMQYISGNSRTVQFSAMMFAKDNSDDIMARLERLCSYCERDTKLKRPPRVLLRVGFTKMSRTSVIESVSNIVYESPRANGSPRGARFQVQLRGYRDYKLSSGAPPESRYAKAKAGEYMELLAQREYGNPLLGDVIRKRHPGIQVLETGVTVKLPSIDAINSVSIAPTSVALKTLTARQDSVQQQLRTTLFDRTNRPYSSTKVPAGL